MAQRTTKSAFVTVDGTTYSNHKRADALLHGLSDAVFYNSVISPVGLGEEAYSARLCK